MGRDSAKSAPSTAAVPLRRKLAVSLELLRDYGARTRDPVDFGPLFADLDAYHDLLRTHTGRALTDARVLEIGYGARPYRLIALISMGVDAFGVDAESPILRGTLAEYRTAFRTNGLERVAKSLVRHTLFDAHERKAFREQLARRGREVRIEPERFHVADAATLEVPEGSLDLIFSEDVFEHVGEDSLTALVPLMARWLKPDGLALIRPNIFTGITGGHLVEWNRRSLATGRSRRRSQPWDHLRARRKQPNTFLNHLWRRDYRELFGRHFEILDEHVALPDLGREHLTGAAAAELAGVPEDELFSNQVRFVLRPLPR
jgi:hypothetical protein